MQDYGGVSLASPAIRLRKKKLWPFPFRPKTCVLEGLVYQKDVENTLPLLLHRWNIYRVVSMWLLLRETSTNRMQCILNRSLSSYLEINKSYGFKLERDLVVIIFLTVMKLVIGLKCDLFSEGSLMPMFFCNVSQEEQQQQEQEQEEQQQQEQQLFHLKTACSR